MLSLLQVFLITIAFALLVGALGVWLAVTSRSESTKDR